MAVAKILMWALFAVASKADMEAGTWPQEPVLWGPTLDLTLFSVGETPKTTLQDLIKQSNQFSLEFAENRTRNSHLLTLVDEKKLEEKIKTAYPIVHEQTLRLYVDFLRQKRRFGSRVERELYQNMTLVGLVDRLLSKRAASFFGLKDEYLLLDKSDGKGGWESVGTESETPPLTLSCCLSYDEIKLAALLSVSSPSYLIKDGKIRGEAVIMGAVGARLEKKFVMEYREVMKTKEQNTHQYGYGQFFIPTMQGVFTNFYGDISSTFEELQWRNDFDNEKYIKINENKYFDKRVYARRLSLSIDSLLFETNDRAVKQKKHAVLYVVALGLNSWRIVPQQDQIFLDTFIKRIEYLGKALGNIKAIYFSPIGACPSTKKIPIEGHVNGGISVEIRDWSIDNVQGSGEGEVVVISYNWNGNALPGNEYWLHKLQASDASITATQTQITENQNPHINSYVQGANLRVVTLQGMVTFREYADRIKNTRNR